MFERTITNTRYAVGDDYTRQTRAKREGIITNTRYAVADYHTRQATARLERTFTNTRYAVGDDNACHTRTLIECIVCNHLCIFVDGVVAVIFVACLDKGMVRVVFVA